MDANEKQAVYDAVDAAVAAGQLLSPEMEAKLDAIIKEEEPDLAKQLNIA